ncbi:DNA excision repair protein ERCC-8 [Chytriomyces hyalinus]|nr:DNA excision repair protein ERCC-8 [Chytriomyces hyalinus]
MFPEMLAKTERERRLNKRWRSLSLDANMQVERAFSAAVTSICIDGTGAFLIAAGSDARINVFDLDNPHKNGRAKVIASADNTYSKYSQSLHRNGGHKFSITGVNWYPNDTGMFTTSSTDKTIRVWDTNCMQSACTFNMREKVYIHCMSSIASTAALIAAGTESSYVRLCDLKTGDHVQMLQGHNGPVSGICWSKTNEFELATSSKDNTIRIWDIRKSNSTLACLRKPTPVVAAPAADTSSKKGKSAAPQFKKSASTLAKFSDVILGLTYTHFSTHLVSVNLIGTFDVWELEQDGSGGAKHVATHEIPNTNFGTDLNCIIPVVPELGSSQVGQEVVVIPSVGYGLRGIGMFDIQSGEAASVLRGHFGRNACAALRQNSQQLYSGGFDGEILQWSPMYMKESFEADESARNVSALEDTKVQMTTASLRHNIPLLLLLALCASSVFARDIPPSIDVLRLVTASNPFDGFESAVPPFAVSAAHFTRPSAIPLFRSMDYCYVEPWHLCTAPKSMVRRLYDTAKTLIVVVWWMVSSTVGFWSRGFVQRIEKRVGGVK